MTTRRRAVLALLASMVMLLAGCRSPSPDAELRAALRETGATGFAYEISAEADRAALDLLGEAAADAAGFLASFRIAGVRQPDGTLTADVDIGGSAPLLQLHVRPDQALLLRTGLPELLGLEGQDPAEALLPTLESRGVSPDAQQALLAAFRGEWLEVADARDAGDLLGGATPATASPAATSSPFDGLRVLGARDADGARRFDVEVDLPVLGQRLGLPLDRLGEVAPGTVTVRDGVVTEVVLALDSRGDGDAAEDAGGVRIVLRLSDHGDADAPVAPEPAAAVSREDLGFIVEQLGAG